MSPVIGHGGMDVLHLFHRLLSDDKKSSPPSSCKKEMKKSWRIYVLKDPNIGGRQGDENGSGDENCFS
jgi:hypothetical protein